MSTASDLKEKLAFLREQGVSGPVEIDGVKFNIPLPPPTPVDKATAARSAKKEYDMMLFAATEGIPDEVDS